MWAVDRRIRVWRSLVSRLNGVQEASSSNLDTRTKKSRTAFAVLDFFFLYVEIRTVSCECPVDICSFPARRERLLSVPNLDTRSSNFGMLLLFWIFSFCMSRFEPFHANVSGHSLVPGSMGTTPQCSESRHSDPHPPNLSTRILAFQYLYLQIPSIVLYCL